MVNRSIFVSSRRISSLVSVSGYLFCLTVRSLSEVSHSDDYQTRNAFKHFEQFCSFFVYRLCSVIATKYLVKRSHFHQNRIWGMTTAIPLH